MNHLLAQSLTLPGNGTIEGPKGLTSAFGSNMTIGSIVSRAIPLVFIFAGVGLFIMLLASGFTFLTSAGDPKKLSQAQGQLTNALVGFVIIFVSFWAVQAAGIIFGLDVVTSIFQ